MVAGYHESKRRLTGPVFRANSGTLHRPGAALDEQERTLIQQKSRVWAHADATFYVLGKPFSLRDTAVGG